MINYCILISTTAITAATTTTIAITATWLHYLTMFFCMQTFNAMQERMPHVVDQVLAVKLFQHVD